MGRRWTLFSFLILTSLLCFGFSLEGNAVHFKVNEALIYLASFSRASAFTIVHIYIVTIYPASLRSRAVGFLTGWSCMAEVLAPIFIDYVPYLNQDQVESFYLMGFAALIAASLCYYFPETIGHPLPESLNDVLYLRSRTLTCCPRIKYEDQKKKYNDVPEKVAPLLNIPNYDTAPTEEIRKWREQAFGVNFLNDAFNMAEVERQTVRARVLQRS